MSDDKNTALATTGETGMSAQQRADMLKNDAPDFLKLVHGIMIPTLKQQGIVADAGDYVVGGKVIPAGMQGQGMVIGVLSDRPRATLFDGNTLLKESTDTTSKEWAEIAALAGAWKKGAKVGAEVLVWLAEVDLLAIIYIANEDRKITYPRLLTAMNEKRFVRLTSGSKPNKYGLKVFPLVADLRDVFVPKVALTEERRAKALEVFEAYKSVKAAPANGPRR